MILRIKRRSQVEWLVLYIFALPFAFSLLMDLLYVPSIIKYTIDIAWVLLLVIVGASKKGIDNPHVARIMLVVGIFILVTLVGLCLEYQSIVYYLWGMRNNIRFFVFFMMCAMVLTRESADSCMRLMDKLFYINLVVTLYQVFVLDLHQDRLGGIFGNSRGCNAYTNIYLMIVVAWHMLRYMHRKETLKTCMIPCLLSLGIAAIAELKMFFFEFAMITALATLMTSFSFRKLGIILGAAIGLVVGVEIIKTRFPDFADWFDWANILESASSDRGYTLQEDMNRLTSLTISWNQFLDTWPRKLFGLGLGNCDYSSSFDFLTSPFYQQYGHLNYVWFSSSFMILENGLLGLVVYAYFFIKVYREAHLVEKTEADSKIYAHMAKIMALMALVLIIYNGSLRMECAYMLYLVLAMPFMKEKRRPMLVPTI